MRVIPMAVFTTAGRGGGERRRGERKNLGEEREEGREERRGEGAGEEEEMEERRKKRGERGKETQEERNCHRYMYRRQ